MTLPELFRSTTGMALIIGLFATLPGCGKPVDTKTPTDKANEKNNNPTGMLAVEPKQLVKTPTITKPPEKVELGSGVGKIATDFLTALHEGKATADQLSASFVKRLGVPIVFDSDKAKGFSSAEAESRLKRLGSGVNFFPPSGFAGENVAVLWGAFMSADRNGGYNLRMVKDGTTWKVDYLSLSSAMFTPGDSAAGGPEAEYQRFAARAIAAALCDKDGAPRDERAAVLAAGLVPALRTAWGDPFDSDKAHGMDYSIGKLLLKADEIGAGVASYSITQQGAEPVFKLEVTKASGAKAAYTLKLTPGDIPGQWLVESITPQS